MKLRLITTLLPMFSSTLTLGYNSRLRHPKRSTASQDLCYSRVGGNAEALYSTVTSLSQILGCSSSSVIHTLIQQRRDFLDVCGVSNICTSLDNFSLPISI
ncbi:MAG: hypothetical protein KME22_17290 [Hassallia sp. WJT32-NPBG1]|nr:hypothetical protein [Hassallia sp. WJT32-NPBG1]